MIEIDFASLSDHELYALRDEVNGYVRQRETVANLESVLIQALSAGAEEHAAEEAYQNAKAAVFSPPPLPPSEDPENEE